MRHFRDTARYPLLHAGSRLGAFKNLFTACGGRSSVPPRSRFVRSGASPHQIWGVARSSKRDQPGLLFAICYL